MSIDGSDRGPEQAGTHIWLRYATHYTKDGRSHTIEISVPVPLGASAPQRERLFREAEAGMNQLVNHFDRHFSAEMAPGNILSAPPQVPASRPAAVSAPPTAPQPLKSSVSREPLPEQKAQHNPTMMVPPTRPNIGASMPHAPGPIGDASSNLQLPQFIQYIRESMGLTPAQAMKMLNVKSLSTGINLREALERLQQLAGHESVVSEAKEMGPRENGTASLPPSTPSQASAPARNTSSDPGSAREIRQPYGFDEEVGPDEAETGALDDELEDLDLPREFSSRELENAQAIINHLRESQGATTVSQKRMLVLNNVVVDQVGEEQLQELAVGVWEINSLKKLKVDQAEALISWAKQDEFGDEFEAVLAMLEEERYARGNR